MQKRKTHNKSRAGCRNCKKRHVKCDEQGPPCANCIVRDTTSTCEYDNRNGLSPPRDVASSASSSGPPSHPITSIKLAFGPHPLLELELMHRWSTCTYKSFCGVKEDHHYLQVELPLYSLKYDFLLQGVMAVSALDIAMCETTAASSRPADYACTAMEYYDKASTLFRAQLSNITPDNVHCIYIFSVIAMSINMAIPQYMREAQQQSPLQHISVLLELVIASTSFYTRYPDWMMGSPLSPSLLASVRLMREPAPELDSATEAALARVGTVVCNGVPVPLENETVGLLNLTQVELYRKSVLGLRFCYTEDAKDLIKGICIAFPTLAGKEFASAVGNLDPVALFIVMHWAVLLDKLGRMCWWARSVGSNLVLEISRTLLQSHPELVNMPEWRGGIVWTRERVGLPAFG